MLLSLLRQWLAQIPDFPRARPRTPVAIGGLNPAAKAFWAGSLAEAHGPVLWVVKGPDEARRALHNLAALGVDDVEHFPGVEVSPYERIAPEANGVRLRQLVLERLPQRPPRIIVTTARGLTMRLVPPVDAKQNRLTIKSGDVLSPQALTEQLVHLGYRPVGNVEEVGEFSRRGGILDLYAPGAELPWRFEWFGDDIESIRTFEPADQRSADPVDEAIIGSPHAFAMPGGRHWAEIDARIRQALMGQVAELYQGGQHDTATQLRASVEADLRRMAGGEYAAGYEYYAPFLYEQGASLLDYLPETALIVWDESAEQQTMLTRWQADILEAHRTQVGQGKQLALPEALFVPMARVQQRIAAFSQVHLQTLGKDSESLLPPISHKFDEMARTMKAWTAEGFRTIAVSAQPQRLMTILRERDCAVSYNENMPVANSLEGGVWAERGSLTQGFAIPGLNVRIVTDAELFGWKPKATSRPAHRAKTTKQEAATRLEDLKPGCYVIHEVHGVGQYLGLEQKSAAGQTREYLALQYASETKLFVPVEQMNLITLYRGSGDSPPKLHKMGGADWQNVRNKTSRAVKELAFDLLELYARRKALVGEALPPDTEWQREMEAAFPYRETPDQMQAIIDTKADMESSQPMDRLICGDVGFGKTEVALRACFKAVMAGKQVVLLCPTTVLAQQHYDVFQERFAPYPIRMALLNRFRSGKETNQIKRELKEGTLDMVVGTHRLLGKEMEFRDLGLVVVDEEHRFGVAHKERLKQMRASVDLLTMSATPIPRTLHMSLSGARDMSLIQTPPENRLPVKTHVGPYTPGLVREALLQELERGGQAFVVHNRVESIGEVLEELHALVPHARYVVAHGQLPEHELENVMLAFHAGEADVMVATSIIESGLDFPQANTMIITDSDRLGLAQLYQLRGRVGRADQQAYAYLLYKPQRQLTEEARARLQTLNQFTSLGSGYQIAMKDMELRGIGNLLGAAQHGHMLSVGFDLYCQLLEEAVAEMKHEPAPHRGPTTVVDLPVAAFVPDSWVEDADAKMLLYRRLAAVERLEELERLATECQDRYGKIPLPAQNLWRVVRLRLRAAALGVTSVTVDAKGVHVTLPLAESAWRELQNSSPALGRWRWQLGEVTTPPPRHADESLELVDKLIDGLSLPLPTPTT
ncbi:MAG: transcription-repair coupling factor [Candidatus Sericytochromatia bacterium]|nr:transcription-repair coupling factor [Candidatus Sericytochromatia bacterium]